MVGNANQQQTCGVPLQHSLVVYLLRCAGAGGAASNREQPVGSGEHAFEIALIGGANQMSAPAATTRERRHNVIVVVGEDQGAHRLPGKRSRAVSATRNMVIERSIDGPTRWSCISTKRAL